MNRHPLFCTELSVSIIMVFIFFFATVVSASDAPSSIVPHEAAYTESVHALLSGLSDEQVRQMLIAELKKDADTESSSFSLETVTEGPAAPLARMLKILDRGSDQAEHQLDKLWKGIPHLLPDLYKVFVSL